MSKVGTTPLRPLVSEMEEADVVYRRVKRAALDIAHQLEGLEGVAGDDEDLGGGGGSRATAVHKQGVAMALNALARDASLLQVHVDKHVGPPTTTIR